MKIGILTFNWAINYGAVLQMFAQYKYLKDKNYDVYIINLDSASNAERH